MEKIIFFLRAWLKGQIFSAKAREFSHTQSVWHKCQFVIFWHAQSQFDNFFLKEIFPKCRNYIVIPFFPENDKNSVIFAKKFLPDKDLVKYFLRARLAGSTTFSTSANFSDPNICWIKIFWNPTKLKRTWLDRTYQNVLGPYISCDQTFFWTQNISGLKNLWYLKCFGT